MVQAPPITPSQADSGVCKSLQEPSHMLPCEEVAGFYLQFVEGIAVQ